MSIVLTAPKSVGWQSITQNNSIPFGTAVGSYMDMWLLPDDTVLVHNGYHPTYGKNVAVFDPSSGLWTAKGDLPVDAIRGTAAFNPNTGKPVIAGPQIVSTNILEYDSTGDSWSVVDNFPAPPHHDTAAITNLAGGGDLVAFSDVVGGYVSTERNSATRWDGSSFTILADIPDSPVATWAYHGIFASTNGYVYLIGGQDYSGSVATDNVYRYNASLNTWSSAANNLPTARISPLVIGLSDGVRAMVLGGGTAGPGGSGESVYIFNSTTESFTSFYGLGLPENGSPLSTGLNSSGGVRLADGNIMVFQGGTLWKTTSPP